MSIILGVAEGEIFVHDAEIQKSALQVRGLADAVRAESSPDLVILSLPGGDKLRVCPGPEPEPDGSFRRRAAAPGPPQPGPGPHVAGGAEQQRHQGKRGDERSRRSARSRVQRVSVSLRCFCPCCR